MRNKTGKNPKHLSQLAQFVDLNAERESLMHQMDEIGFSREIADLVSEIDGVQAVGQHLGSRPNSLNIPGLSVPPLFPSADATPQAMKKVATGFDGSKNGQIAHGNTVYSYPGIFGRDFVHPFEASNKNAASGTVFIDTYHQGMAVENANELSHIRNRKIDSGQKTIDGGGVEKNFVRASLGSSGSGSSPTSGGSGNRIQKNDHRLTRYIDVNQIASQIDQAKADTSLGQFLSWQSGLQIDRKSRYIYTQKLGWIDLQHVLSAANFPLGSMGLGNVVGTAVEAGQLATPYWRSAFNKEDLVSNNIGSMAAQKVLVSGGKITLGEAVAEIIQSLGPMSHRQADSHLRRSVR